MASLSLQTIRTKIISWQCNWIEEQDNEQDKQIKSVGCMEVRWRRPCLGMQMGFKSGPCGCLLPYLPDRLRPPSAPYPRPAAPA